jgi:hypothetical protein
MQITVTVESGNKTATVTIDPDEIVNKAAACGTSVREPMVTAASAIAELQQKAREQQEIDELQKKAKAIPSLVPLKLSKPQRGTPTLKPADMPEDAWTDITCLNTHKKLPMALWKDIHDGLLKNEGPGMTFMPLEEMQACLDTTDSRVLRDRVNAFVADDEARVLILDLSEYQKAYNSSKKGLWRLWNTGRLAKCVFATTTTMGGIVGIYVKLQRNKYTGELRVAE